MIQWASSRIWLWCSTWLIKWHTPDWCALTQRGVLQYWALRILCRNWCVDSYAIRCAGRRTLHLSSTSTDSSNGTYTVGSLLSKQWTKAKNVRIRRRTHVHLDSFLTELEKVPILKLILELIVLVQYILATPFDKKYLKTYSMYAWSHILSGITSCLIIFIESGTLISWQSYHVIYNYM